MITMKIYTGEERLAECPLSSRAFKMNPGKPVYSCNGVPVSPSYAMSQGFTIDPAFVLPGSVRSKLDLTEFLHTCGLKNADSQYQELYEKFSDDLPMSNRTFI